MLSMIGMIIGAGLFGVPFAISKSGVDIGLLYFIGIGLVLTLMHLMYGEVVLRTKEKHRLPGFVKLYLGEGWSWFTKISSTLGYYIALVAYMILGGKFVFFLLGPVLGGTELIYQIVYFIVLGSLLFWGLKPIFKIESILTFSLIGLIVFLIVLAIPYFDIQRLPLSDSQYAFLPYGILLFALSGTPAIPELRDILKNNLSKMKKVIILSTLFCIIITALFALSAVGIAGSFVHPDAISTFAEAMGPWILIIGSIIGFLAVTTSFLVVGMYLLDQFKYDFKFNHVTAFFWALVIPFLILLFVIKDFIIAMSIGGALFAATDSIMLAIIWRKTKTMGNRHPEYQLKMGNWIAWIIILMFVVGGVTEIFSLLH